MICGKVTYSTRAEAIASIRGFKVSKHPRRSKKQADAVYYCDGCQGYHLYTKGKRKHRRQAEVSVQPQSKPRQFVNLVIHHKMKIK